MGIRTRDVTPIPDPDAAVAPVSDHPDAGHAPDGMNVAIQEIKKAMKELGSFL